jgi:hypothetical protein
MEKEHRASPAPVQVVIGGTTGLLLLRLMEALGTEDGGGVISRALGLFDLVLRKQREGLRLVLIDPRTGQESEVAI